MTATLLAKKLVALNSWELTFKPTTPLKFTPGQYCTISLPQLKSDPRGPGRIFSLVNSPHQKNLAVILFRNRPSPFKKLLLELPLGSKVTLTPPIGLFDLPTNPRQELAFLAAGVGIAPFMSALRFLKESKQPNPISLFYTNPNKDSACYLDTLPAFFAPSPQRLLPIFTNESSRLDLKTVKSQLTNFATCWYYLAGSPSFVEDWEEKLIKEGIAPKQIRRESFDGYE